MSWLYHDHVYIVDCSVDKSGDKSQGPAPAGGPWAWPWVLLLLLLLLKPRIKALTVTGLSSSKLSKDWRWKSKLIIFDFHRAIFDRHLIWQVGTFTFNFQDARTRQLCSSWFDISGTKWKLWERFSESVIKLLTVTAYSSLMPEFCEEVYQIQIQIHQSTPSRRRQRTWRRRQARTKVVPVAPMLY